MPPPIRKVPKVPDMDEVIVRDGREVRKGDIVEFEIEKRLGAGQGMEDIMSALRKQGIDASAKYVRDRMTVARGRKPIGGDRGYDKRYTRMELNYLIERGLSNGAKEGLSYDDTWALIRKDIETAYPNRDVSRIIEVAKNKQAKLIQQNSPPAVIDTDEVAQLEARLERARQRAREEKTFDARDEVAFVEQLLENARRGGPNAGPEQPPYADPTNPVRDLKEFEGMDDAGLMEVLKRVGDEAAKRKKAQIQGLREKGAQKAEQFDWSQLDELGKMWAEGTDLRFAKASEGGDPVEGNLDVPIEQPGINGPVEPEFRNR